MTNRLADILDLPVLQSMLESLHRASGIPLGIVDANGSMLIATGWQPICSEYHRKHKLVGQRCLLNRLASVSGESLDFEPEQPYEFVCESGLVDIGLPLFFEGDFLGLLFLGQFLYEQPNPEHFKRQAIDFGFDPDSYLDLLKQVPVIPREKVAEYLKFHKSLVEMLTETGLRKIKEIRARNELVESEENFRSIFESAAVGMATLNVEGRFTQVNPAFCRFLGYSAQELLSKSVTDVTASEDLDASLLQLHEAWRGERRVIDMEKRYLRKDGTRVWGRVTATHLSTNRENPIASVAMIQDISERKSAELALLESEQRFRSVIEEIPLGLHMYQLMGENRLVFSGYNPAADTILKLDNSQFLGQDILQAFPGLADKGIVEGYLDVCRTGKPMHLELLSYQDEKIQGAFEIHAFQTGPDRIASLFTDITERMRAEKAVRTSESTLKSLLAAAPMSIGLVHNRVFSWVNRWMMEELGYTKEELIGQSARMLYEDDAEFDHVGRMKYPRVSMGQMGQVATRWRCKDGQVIDVLLRSIPVEPGNLDAGVIFTALNITEQRRYEETLRNRELLLHSVLNSADNAMIALDSDRRLIYFNQQYQALFPFDREWLETHPTVDDLIRKACEIGLYPKDQVDVLIDRRIQHLKNASDQAIIETPRLDGKLLEGFANTLPDGGYLISFRDITAQRQAEDDLRSSEERARLLLESSGEAIYGLDLEGRCTFANPMCIELLGYENESDLLGQKMHDLIHHTYEDGSPCPAVECKIHLSFMTGQEVHVDDEVLWRRDGSCFSAEYWSSPIIKAGRIVGVVVNFVDITKRKRADEELRNALSAMARAHEQINTILRSVADGLLVFNAAGRIVLVNPAAEQLLGQKVIDLAGADISEKLPDPVFLHRVKQALVGNEYPAPFDLSAWSDSSGRDRIVQARIAAIEGEGDEFSGVVALLRDVTRERELDQLKDEFISTAAHELRTPMTSIIGYSELILEQLDELSSIQLKEFMEIIQSRADALSDIITDMLDLSRVHSGRLIQLDRQRGDFGRLVKDILQTYHYGDHEFLFACSIPESLPDFWFDYGKMTQVLDNLLSNAIKFSPHGGTITVRLHAGEDQLLVRIIDQGIGMSQDQIERVFDKFYRADATNTAVSGLGLGMSLVKGIIEGHGGRIWVESTPTIGTKVSFTLSMKPPEGHDS